MSCSRGWCWLSCSGILKSDEISNDPSNILKSLVKVNSISIRLLIHDTNLTNLKRTYEQLINLSPSFCKLWTFDLLIGSAGISRAKLAKRLVLKNFWWAFQGLSDWPSSMLIPMTKFSGSKKWKLQYQSDMNQLNETLHSLLCNISIKHQNRFVINQFNRFQSVSV